MGRGWKGERLEGVEEVDGKGEGLDGMGWSQG